MEAKKIFHDVFQNIEVGIGEVSKTVGVSQRQLRYWEEKGYIKPVDDNQSGVRRYTLSTLYLIIFIKTQLDQGFTLSAAFERSKDIKVKSKIVRNFFEHTFNDVTITDADKAYGEIDLGELLVQDGQKYHFNGVVDEHGRYLKIDK
ncbi:MerR family transcriptional regulator [Lactobacillus johnsonii]|uniref:MerR family transcriptional regulator n=1 Tax=Lactobacillus johnsonii TaxID=33959 RepID=UPI0039824CCC